MIGGIGLPELIIILVIVLIIFGAGKLPEIGAGLGKGIRNFKKATSEPEEIDVTPSKEQEKLEEATSQAQTEAQAEDTASKDESKQPV